jgi:hypothetical protein
MKRLLGLLLAAALAASPAAAQTLGGNISTPSGSGATLGANTFTGTQTYAPPSGTGNVEKIVDISAIDSNATLFRCSIGVYAGVNGSDPTKNDVYGCGWNWSAGGNGRLNPTKPAVGISFERYFAAGGTSATRASELHLTSWTEAGVEQRMFSSNIRHDGTLISTTMMADVIALSDRASVVPIQFNITNRQVSLTSGTQVLWGVNNVVVAQQRNADDSAYLALPWYNSENRLVAGPAAQFVGATPTTGSYANSFFLLQATSLPVNGQLLGGLLPTVAGDVWPFNFAGDIGGVMAGEIYNQRTSNTGAHAALNLRVTASGGSPFVLFAGTGNDFYSGVSRSTGKWSISVNDRPGNADRLTLDTTGNLVASGSLKGGTPSGGTAAAWKPGILVTSTTCTAETTKYVQLDVGGSLIKVATCQ